MIAAIKVKRNCLYVEKNALLFINSKIHTTDVLNKCTDDGEQTQETQDS